MSCADSILCDPLTIFVGMITPVDQTCLEFESVTLVSGSNMRLSQRLMHVFLNQWKFNFTRLTFSSYYNKVDYIPTDVDECVSIPCQNGGSCVDYVNGYFCKCPVEVYGINCETGE